MLYANVQSVLSNYAQCEILISENEPEVFATVETHLTADISDNEVCIEGYNIIRSDSPSRHTAGVAIYVRATRKYSSVDNIAYDFNNILIVDIHNGSCRGRWFIIYHSPNCSTAGFIDKLQGACERFASDGRVCYFIGDFNINCHQNASSTYKSQLLQLMTFYGMKLMIRKYTRVNDRSKTMIDLLFTNSKTLKVNVKDIDMIADHKTIEVHKNLNRSEKIMKNVIDRSNYNAVAMNEQLEQCEVVQTVNESRELDSKINYLETALRGGVANLMNEKTVTVNYANKWFCEDLKTLRGLKDRLHWQAQLTDNENDWVEYRRIRNQYSMRLRSAKSEHNRDTLRQLKNDPKRLWRKLKGNKSENELTSEVIVNGETLEDPLTIATRLNEFFKQSVIDIDSTITYEPHEDPEYNYPTFHEFKLINETDLTRVMQRMKKSCGLDNVNVGVVRDAMPTIGQVYVDIINSSLQAGYCPLEWRRTIITPIPKIKGTKKAEELRPVNQTITTDKIAENIVKEQLQIHFNQHSIISQFQSAFRPNHSCETAINMVLADWHRELDKNNVIIAVFLDLKRAFETVDQEIMAKVLHNYGVRGTVLNWIKSWLTDRQQRTQFNGHTSPDITINVGLPQGTPLSCELFAIYINLIATILKHCKIKIFADDTLIWIIAPRDKITHVVQLLNEDLQRIGLFFKRRRLKLNVSKTKFMIIASPRLQVPNVSLQLCDEDIECVSLIKYLGVMIDRHLKFKDHFEYVKKKMIKKISFLQRNRNKFDRVSRLLIFKSLISPHIDYCSSILFLCNEAQIHELQILQNRAMRAILRRDRYSNVRQMLADLDLLDVRQRIYFNVLLLIHKAKLGILPPYLSQHLNYVSDVQPYMLRTGNCFRLPNLLGAQGQNSIFYKGVQLYNGFIRLVGEDMNLDDINVFRRELINYVRLNFASA